jgi:hypothetical protein
LKTSTVPPVGAARAGTNQPRSRSPSSVSNDTSSLPGNTLAPGGAPRAPGR